MAQQRGDGSDPGTPETYEALDKAVAAHFRENGMVVEWVVMVRTMDMQDIANNLAGYNQDTKKGQPFNGTVGLLNIGLWSAQEYWGEED